MDEKKLTNRCPFCGKQMIMKMIGDIYFTGCCNKRVIEDDDELMDMEG